MKLPQHLAGKVEVADLEHITTLGVGEWQLVIPAGGVGWYIYQSSLWFYDERQPQKAAWRNHAPWRFGRRGLEIYIEKVSANGRMIEYDPRTGSFQSFIDWLEENLEEAD